MKLSKYYFFSEKQRELRKDKMEVTIQCGHNFPKADIAGWCDPYVLVAYRDGTKDMSFKTKIVSKTAEPIWNETFKIEKPTSYLTFRCYDFDRMAHDDYLGCFCIYSGDMPKSEEEVTFKVDLSDEFKEAEKKDKAAETTVTVKFAPLN